jgi:hypothetical protein
VIFISSPDSFRLAGQNLALSQSNVVKTVDQNIEWSLNAWFNEYKKATIENIQRIGSTRYG